MTQSKDTTKSKPTSSTNLFKHVMGEDLLKWIDIYNVINEPKVIAEMNAFERKVVKMIAESKERISKEIHDGFKAIEESTGMDFSNYASDDHDDSKFTGHRQDFQIYTEWEDVGTLQCVIAAYCKDQMKIELSK